MTGRRGFTLFEMVLAMVAGGIIAVLTFAMSSRLEMVARQRGERSGLTANLGTVAQTLGFDLSLLGFDSLAGADLGVVAPNAVTYRARRGMIVVCRVAVDTVVMAPGWLPRFRARLPDPSRDSLLLYLPGDSTGALDLWKPVPLVAGPVGAVCPTGEAGALFLAAIDSTSVRQSGPSRRTVAWYFESVNARAYSSATGWQFGIEGLSAGATVQPVAGRLIGPSGLEVVPVDRSGVPLGGGGGGSVAGLEIIVRGRSSREMAVGPSRVAAVTDSVRTLIRFRNVP